MTRKNHLDENEKASRWFLKNITMIFKGHHGAEKTKSHNKSHRGFAMTLVATARKYQMHCSTFQTKARRPSISVS